MFWVGFIVSYDYGKFMADIDSINLGFSREAEFYEADELKNPVIISLRKTIRSIVAKHIPAGGSILEINAGTGLDALWFANHGYRIHATDIADGMLSALETKVNLFGKPNQFSFQKLSFLELENANHIPFDGVFSDFGGLNCTNDLPTVVQGIEKVLKPNGYVVWVLMPKICFWEIAQIFLGRINVAIRRFKKDGVQANVRGALVKTYYYSVKQIKQTLGENFEIIHFQSLSLFAPPMNQMKFINSFPQLTKLLLFFDEIVGKLPLFNRCGDFIILIARYRSNKNAETNRY